MRADEETPLRQRQCASLAAIVVLALLLVSYWADAGSWGPALFLVGWLWAERQYRQSRRSDQ